MALLHVDFFSDVLGMCMNMDVILVSPARSPSFHAPYPPMDNPAASVSSLFSDIRGKKGNCRGFMHGAERRIFCMREICWRGNM